MRNALGCVRYEIARANKKSKFSGSNQYVQWK